jgi:hypothetical protein
VLLRLSEGTPVEPALYERALSRADINQRRLQIGYVVIDPSRCAPELIAFAQQAFQMTLVAKADGLELYRTKLAPPIETVGSR